mmetsp:Transcript_32635/g.87613  ORF Transcript_32635/g.87613 Transcript_32635/m.87613 type:complete len:93 (+) Transcript_32635:950-1228(+)
MSWFVCMVESQDTAAPSSQASPRLFRELLQLILADATLSTVASYLYCHEDERALVHNAQPQGDVSNERSGICTHQCLQDRQIPDALDVVPNA